MIPSSLTSSVEEHLQAKVTNISRASGGSINQAGVVELADGTKCFLKWNRNAPDDMFPKEKKGLELLRSADTDIHIPEVYNIGLDTKSNSHYILIEFLQEGRASSDSAQVFGRELAKMHQNRTEQFGLDYDNYIGRLHQSNSWHTTWNEFFVEERLGPQVKMALDSGKLDSADQHNFENLYRELPTIMPDEPPVLLHGDLWGGNYFYDTEGTPAIYDPAVYYGNREIELAFTHLFGGFSRDFYSSYEDEWPLEPGFASRKDIYNLYPLLVHVNMFGGHYGSQVRSIIKRFG